MRKGRATFAYGSHLALGCAMTGDELLQTLQQLEVELHQEATRCDRSRMERLLHPDFEEFARSGRRFTREQTLAEFASTGAHLPSVVSDGFKLARLSEDWALLTYVSAHLDRSGHPYRHTLRSSLWVRGPNGWQVRFHQGTPTDGFSD